MLASLALPRIATALLVLAFVGAIAVVNLFSLFGATLGGTLLWIDRLGPPLATAMLVALAPWVETAGPQSEPLLPLLRLALWIGGDEKADDKSLFSLIRRTLEDSKPHSKS